MLRPLVLIITQLVFFLAAGSAAAFTYWNDIRTSALLPDDTVVIAGKGHEDYQIVGREKLPFDDREEARRALRSLAMASEEEGA